MTTKDQELAELRARVAQLERAARPVPSPDPRSAPRFDPTERMSMPASTLREMAAAVPDRMVREIATDRAATRPVSAVEDDAPRPSRKGIGWVDPRPISPPPGINHADRLMDQQDRIDREELMARSAKR
jgi:hypothetical protein